MIGMLIRIFGGILLAGFIVWVVYVFALGLGVFFKSKPKNKTKDLADSEC